MQSLYAQFHHSAPAFALRWSLPSESLVSLWKVAALTPAKRNLNADFQITNHFPCLGEQDAPCHMAVRSAWSCVAALP